MAQYTQQDQCTGCALFCSSPASRTAGYLQICAVITQTACNRQGLLPESGAHTKGQYSSLHLSKEIITHLLH